MQYDQKPMMRRSPELHSFVHTLILDGAYCVANALHFLSEKIARESNWIPSFEMRDGKGNALEADFGMLAAPSRFSHTSSPHLIIGECKSFNRFEEKDFQRTRKAGTLFPGAVLCFCTFNESLDEKEIDGLTRIVNEGREKWAVQKQANPVLILTGRELFSEFKLAPIESLYGEKGQHARAMFIRDDMDDLCDFMQQFYLGIPSRHQWLETKRKKQLARKASKVPLIEKQLSKELPAGER